MRIQRKECTRATCGRKLYNLQAGNQLAPSMQAPQHTLTTPSVPAVAATISPQYRSLHHDSAHPPSASRAPAPEATRAGASASLEGAFASACATSEGGGPPSGANVSAAACAVPGVVAATLDVDVGTTRAVMSISVAMGQACKAGCSRHSYTRNTLSEEIVAFKRGFQPSCIYWIGGYAHQLESKMMRCE
jgi:hypothetical protein